MNTPARFLALDTSTDTMTVALGVLGQAPLVHHREEGGAKASATLLPRIAELLAAQGWALSDLDGIAFGQGPGAFTGLRTACSVVQGLAFGLQSGARPDGLPVVPVSTLLACAEDARAQALASVEGQATGVAPEAPWRVLALLDARMNEVYAATCDYTPEQGWQMWGEPTLVAPQAVTVAQGVQAVVGNAWPVYANDWSSELNGLTRWHSVPTAAACLALAQRAWAQHAWVTAVDAQPLYVRNKVAQTTAEREALAVAKAAAAHRPDVGGERP